MTVRVLAFARVREVAGFARSELTLPHDARIADAWELLAQKVPALAALRACTRIARNGRIAEGSERLADGDELALLPPSGGG
ncbi:MAG: MoaD/ThiS family protein [Candidatus Tyrphobacter sp.]